MISDYTRYDLEYVAPLTGSVDRNNDLTEIQKQQARRSPHGERG